MFSYLFPFLLWTVFASTALYLEFFIVFLILSLITAVLINLRSDKSSVSAYSVFNRGHALAGTLDAADYDDSLRHRGTRKKEFMGMDGMVAEPASALKQSKNANSRCICGSGRKFKRCCGRNLGRMEEIERKQQFERDWM